MKFNDTSSKTGICQDIDFMCHTDTTSYPLKDKARNVNTWYRKSVSWIRECHGDWEYDDSNLSTSTDYPTALPIWTTKLVANTQSYTLPSTAQKVERVEVLDDEANYQIVSPIDKEQITDEAMSEFEETAGLPKYYDMVGALVVLYPKPGASFITTTSGLKVYVARDIDEFHSTDTTQEPGFVSNFHRILSLGGAFDFEEDPTKKNYLLAQIRDLRTEIKEFYSTRHKDFRNIIQPYRTDYR